MKVVALYLPQFHEIPENNRWWGEGFTEWTNTKKARPLFRDHYQPRIPLDNYYYNLLDKSALQWQANLAKTYGVYGFCFYHYWFGGKMLLQKPAELLLSAQDIDMRFFFSWANESWTRTWNGDSKSPLMTQVYGDKEAWTEHFNYLLPFFKDERYMKTDGKPMFAIYNSVVIPNCDQMLELWDTMAKENGLPGIFAITTLNQFAIDAVHNHFDAQFIFEPMYTRKHDESFPRKCVRKSKQLIREKLAIQSSVLIDYADYQDVWDKIIRRDHSHWQRRTFWGAFVDWDNTARKGYNGTVFRGASPEAFGRYFSTLVQKALAADVEYIFINAWNEWAESTYLEPDQRHRYSYLEAVKTALTENGISVQTTSARG